MDQEFEEETSGWPEQMQKSIVAGGALENLICRREAKQNSKQKF